MCPAPAQPYWNPLIGIFHIFRPFSTNKTSETQQHPLAQIPMRQGRENRKERRRDLSSSLSLSLSFSPLLFSSLVFSASNETRGQMGHRRRGWQTAPVCFCSLLFPTVMEARKIPTPPAPAFTADISFHHHRRHRRRRYRHHHRRNFPLLQIKSSGKLHFSRWRGARDAR